MGNVANISMTDRPGWANRLLGGRIADNDLAALLAVSRAVRLEANATALRAHEDRLLLLVRGTVKAHLVTDDGDEVITAIQGPGHAAGLLHVLGHAEIGVDITSLEPIDALTVSGPEFRSLLEQRSSIMAGCLRTVASQHAAANAERARFAGTCISQRVASRLLELATRWGQPDGDRVHITLPLTQEELAAWSGASRESVAKVLQAMRASGLLETGRRSLTVLDLPRLQQRCDRSAPDDLGQLLATIR